MQAQPAPQPSHQTSPTFTPAERVQILNGLLGSDFYREWRFPDRAVHVSSTAFGYDITIRGLTGSGANHYYFELNLAGEVVRSDEKAQIGCLVKRVGPGPESELDKAIARIS